MSVSQIILPVACAAVLSSAFSYCFARYSGRLRLVAKPRPDRWHETPTPNTGGLGILIACSAAYLLFARAGYGTIAACAGLVALLGFVDDRVQLPPIAKLAGQAVATAVVIISGITFHWTPWIWANVMITALWIIGITNAFNLIDNMDGLCAGVAAIAAASGAALAFLEQDGQRMLLLMIIGASCLGFLIFNYKPARIFMGDCGSMFLGFSLASLAVGSPREADSMLDGFYAPSAFLYPIFDTVLVSVLRRAAGRPISVGGRDHSSHRLVIAGLTEQEAVWALWAIAGICAAYGPLAYHHPDWFLIATASLLVALGGFGYVLAVLPAFGFQSPSQSSKPIVAFLQRGTYTTSPQVSALPSEASADRAAVYAQGPVDRFNTQTLLRAAHCGDPDCARPDGS